MAHGKLFIDTSVERELKVVVIGDLEAARQAGATFNPGRGTESFGSTATQPFKSAMRTKKLYHPTTAMDLVVIFLEKVGYVGTFWARKLLPLQCVIDWVRMGGLGINERERDRVWSFPWNWFRKMR